MEMSPESPLQTATPPLMPFPVSFHVSPLPVGVQKPNNGVEIGSKGFAEADVKSAGEQISNLTRIFDLHLHTWLIIAPTQSLNAHPHPPSIYNVTQFSSSPFLAFQS